MFDENDEHFMSINHVDVIDRFGCVQHAHFDNYTLEGGRRKAEGGRGGGDACQLSKPLAFSFLSESPAFFLHRLVLLINKFASIEIKPSEAYSDIIIMD